MFSELIEHLRSELAYYHPREIRFRRALAQRDARYDAANGVDTTSFLNLKKLSIASLNRRYGVPHIATPPEEFSRAMAALPVRHEDYAFIDLGSGKGRALLLAAAFPFRRLIGVEFAQELHEIARENLNGRSSVELYCMDATEYGFPDGPLIVFLYNPFGPEVMAKVAQRLSGRPSTYVVYINPFHVDSWLKAGFRVIARGEPFMILSTRP